MRTKGITIQCIVNIVFIILTVAVSPAEEIDKIWRWHQQSYEIYHPSFSPNNKYIVFTRKVHEPDGHEAEMYSEKELKRYEDHQKQNNRYADPEIVIVDTGTKKINKIEWGWTPGVSPDGQNIVFAYQQKPISGYRVLADTLAGNEIHEYNISTGKIRTLAKPESGYLSNPLYSSNDEIVFSFSDAVNGAYGGDVGLGKVNTKTLSSDILYKPQREHDLYHLIDAVRANNGNILCIRKRPADTGMYLANSYYYELIQIGRNKEASVLYDWGRIKLGNRVKIGYKLGSDGEIQVFKENQGWKSVTNKNDSSKTISDYGVVSPNGEYIVLSNETNIAVKKFDDSKFNKTWKVKGELRAVKWSSDSKKIILVVTKYKGSSEIFDFDELLILEIGK